LDVLQARGLAERRTGTDRRRNSIHVTPAGRRTVAEIRHAIWSAEDELLSHLPGPGRDSLQSLLENVSDPSTRALGRDVAND
ncbi:MAG: hypothetical protein ACRDQ0_13075, partial [Pseudonocardia sp.]